MKNLRGSRWACSFLLALFLASLTPARSAEKTTIKPAPTPPPRYHMGDFEDSRADHPALHRIENFLTVFASVWLTVFIPGSRVHLTVDASQGRVSARK